MHDRQKYGINDTFKWLSSKNAGDTIVIVACQWSTNKSDWLYTVRYFSDGRFRRYVETFLTKHAVFTGVFLGDALKGASDAELADIVETKLHGNAGPATQTDALARVKEFNPFEVPPERAKKLATVHDILDACAKKFGTDSPEFKGRMNWYDTIEKVGFKKAVGIL